jgi:hypothetical protein
LLVKMCQVDSGRGASISHPAMEAGISDHVWSPEEIAGLAD